MQRRQWKENGKIPAWNPIEVGSESEVTEEARMKGAKSSFCLVDGHLSFEECWMGQKNSKM